LFRRRWVTTRYDRSYRANHEAALCVHARLPFDVEVCIHVQRFARAIASDTTESAMTSVVLRIALSTRLFHALPERQVCSISATDQGQHYNSDSQATGSMKQSIGYVVQDYDEAIDV
jgi:hypothetical protein